MITGPAGEGTLVTFGPDPRANAAAAPVVRRSRGQGFDLLGYTLHTYAAGKGMGAGGPEGRVHVLADRGMISAAALEERGLEYILGVRERSTKEVREVVLADEVPLVTITVPRQKRPDTELQAKQARLGKVRYIVCRNPAEAERDAAGRGLHPSSKPNGEWARNLSRRSFGEPYNAAQNALASSMVGSGQLEPARSSVIR